MLLADFEARVNAIARRTPGMPRDAVMVVRMVRLLERLLEERMNAIWAAEGLNASSWSVLMMIYADPGSAVSPSCISNAVAQSRAHMTRIADELVAGHWVERQPSTVDRRSVSLALTEEGRSRLDALLPSVGRCYQEALDMFSGEETELLGNLLRRWITALEAKSDTPCVDQRKESP